MKLYRRDINYEYSNKDLILRSIWGCIRILFRFSPRTFFAFRRYILLIFGAKIGRGTRIYPSVKIFAPWNLEIGAKTAIGENVIIYNLGKIQIGDHVTISQRAHLCAGTHDYLNLDKYNIMPLIKSKISISDGVWLCTESFIGPNIRIGKNSIIAARAVVVKDVEENQIMAGNPAKFIKDRYG